MGVISSVFSLEDREVPFAWKPVPGAGAYLVEVMDEKGAIIFRKTISENEEPLVKFQLYPSKYSVRLTTINRFMQSEASTAWKSFVVAANASPVFEALSPATQTWGDLKVIDLRGADLAGNLTADLVGRDGKHYPLGMVNLDRNHWELNPPADLDPDHYDLVLSNSGQYQTTVKGAFNVMVTQPLVKSVEPSQFRIDHAPKQLHLSGSRFFEGVQVYLKKDQEVVPLTVMDRSFDGLTLAWPSGVKTGAYRLIAVNGNVGYPGEVPLQVDEPLDPVMTSLGKKLVRNSELPLKLKVTGSDFSPEAHLWLVRDQELFSTPRKVPLSVTFLDSQNLEAGLGKGDSPLEVGNWHLELVNEPGKKTIEGPHLEVAEDPISRQLRFAAGWDGALMLGDWAAIYRFAGASADASVTYYFTEHKRPISGYAWDFGASFQVDGLYFGNSWDPGKVDSNLTAFSAQLYPVVELTWLPVTLRLRLGGGLVFTNLAVTVDDVSRQKLVDQELMPATTIGLGAEVPLNDLCRVELGLDWSRYYFTQSIDLLKIGCRGVLALPTH